MTFPERDKVQERALGFWRRRSVVGGWPLERKGLTFLGNAVHLVGAALFDDWQGTEPITNHLPRFDGSTSYGNLGYAEHFALDLLIADNPDLRSSEPFWSDTKVHFQNNGTHLSDEQWKNVRKIYMRDIYAHHLTATHRMNIVVHTIATAAAAERLLFFTRSAAGEYKASPPVVWQSEVLYTRFFECQMNPNSPDIATLPSVYEILYREQPQPLLPGNHWIYVTTESLEAFLAEFAKPQREPTMVDQSPTPQASDDREIGQAVDLPEGFPATFYAWLRNQILASPSIRALNKSDQIKVGTGVYGHATNKANSIRETVLVKLEEEGGRSEQAAKIWRTSGPKKTVH